MKAIFLETGEMRWLGIGVVNEGYDTTDMPGWYYGSVGYHTDDGKIFHNTGSGGRETKGNKKLSSGPLFSSWLRNTKNTRNNNFFCKFEHKVGKGIKRQVAEYM